MPRLWSCPTATATESYIQDTQVPLETALASPPSQGVQSGSTTGLQGMEGMSLGGELVLVSACLTVTPLITDGPEHTHSGPMVKNLSPSPLVADILPAFPKDRVPPDGDNTFSLENFITVTCARGHFCPPVGPNGGCHHQKQPLQHPWGQYILRITP